MAYQNNAGIPADRCEIPNEVRPKVRYWVPGAAMRDEDLKEELRRLKDLGFGGVEVVGLLNTPDEVIRGEDGWGTEHWDHVLNVIDETAAELGMSVDPANGPMWPISMPTVEGPDDPAALTELTYGVLDIGPEGGYDGALPQRRTVHPEGVETLVHALAYRRNGKGQLVLDSYTDLREKVYAGTAPSETRNDAHIRVQLPAAGEDETWLVFAFFMQPSTQRTGVNSSGDVTEEIDPASYGESSRAGTYYVVDHLSRAGAGACRAYWEPKLRHTPMRAGESLFCDSLEYKVSMDWTRGLECEFEARRGYSLLPYLPFIGFAGTYPPSDVPGYVADRPEIGAMADQDYREVLTQLYCENHLAALEEMTQELGLSIRYQVAYNKMFEEERCPLYVGIPENEALGRSTMDGMKTMAAAAQLGRKPRYSFECAAEFGNAYGQDHEDLLWWVKRSLMSGMNAQVLHGAAYSGGYDGEYSENGAMKGVRWPGYEAFGRFISNCWNRTLSVQDTRGCMDAIARMNMVFRHTTKVDCAVYRSSYENDGLGGEFMYFPDGGRLMNAGYSYETISAFLLGHPNCVVRGGVLDPDGAAWHCLLIPPQESASGDLLTQVKRLLEEGFPVIWFGEKPLRAQYLSEWRTPEARSDWQQRMDGIWSHPGLTHAEEIEDASAVLHALGIRPRVEPEAADTAMDLACAAHEDEETGTRWYALYGYNRVEYAPDLSGEHEEFGVSAIFRKGTTKSSYHRPGASSRRRVKVSLAGTGAVSVFDPWTGIEEALPGFRAADAVEERMVGEICLEEDEMVILAVRAKEPGSGEAPAADGSKAQVGGSAMACACRAAASGAGPSDADAAEHLRRGSVRELPVRFDTLTLREFGPDTPDEKSFLRSGFHGPGRRIDLREADLRAWKELDPLLVSFVGEGVYQGRFELDQVRTGRRYLLSLGDVCDTFRVRVNGKETGFPDQVMKRVDITNLVREGENTLEVRVVSNLYNRLVYAEKDLGLDFELPRSPKPYGIWETEGKRCALYEI